MREKNQFIKNHPTFYSFLTDSFGKKVSKGTTIEIRVCEPNEVERVETIEIQESDIPLFKIVEEFFE